MEYAAKYMINKGIGVYSLMIIGASLFNENLHNEESNWDVVFRGQTR